MDRTLAKRMAWHKRSDGQKAAMGIALLLVVYGILVFGVLPRHVFFSGDGGMKFALTASVARTGNLWHVAYEYPGIDIDPEFAYFPFSWMWVKQGRPVPVYLWALIFVNAPLYRLFGIDALYAVSLLSGVGVAWLSYKLAQQMRAPRPWVVVLLTGLCTPMFFYSLVAWDHAQIVLLSTSALYLLARQAYRRRRWEVVLAGVVSGLGLWTRYEMFLMVPVLVLSYVYVFRGKRGVWRDAAIFAAGLGLVLVGMLAQQMAVMGTMVPSVIGARTSTIALAQEGAASTLDIVRNLILRQAQVIFALTFDGSAVWAERILLAAAFVAVIVVHRFAALRLKPMLVLASVFLLLAGVLLAFLHPRVSSPPTGLIVTLPLSALGLVYLPLSDHEHQKSRRVYDLAMTVNVLFLFLGIFTIPFAPGYSWGPRYLAPVFPLVATLAWVTMNRSVPAHPTMTQRRTVYAAFALLGVASLVIQIVGLGRLYDKKRQMEDWYDATAALNVDYVISEDKDYLQEMAGFYLEKKLFQVQDRAEYADLVSSLFRAGARRYAFIQVVHSQIDPLIETPAFRVVETGRVYEITAVGQREGK